MKSKQVTMDSVDFWNLRAVHERLAVKSKDIREIVLCAKVRLDNVCTIVSNGDRPKQLCYEEDNEHMFTAMGLLIDARDIEKNDIPREP